VLTGLGIGGLRTRSLPALHTDGRIETSCPDCGEVLDVEVHDGRSDDGILLFHCLVPAPHWWADIALHRSVVSVILAPPGRLREVWNMRWWLRSLAIGAAVGLAVGLVVGGTLGRVFTGQGTTAIYIFGAVAGTALGVAYAAGRTLLPSGRCFRTILFTLGTTAFMLGQIVRGNREDFSFLQVTLSLLLVVGSVALTAVPVPLLVERLAPDHERRPGRVTQGVVALGMTGFAVFGVTGITLAYGM
jgi:hypothetical protein